MLSGRATDFDADGCADETEDHDKDNDGILDSQDKCPYTPQKYAFVSNAARDFDADGCMDGVEDSDDDNDSIPNLIDACPLTGGGEAPDGEGCSALQRELKAAAELQGKSLPDLPNLQEAPLERKRTKLEECIDLVISCTLQMILGAILSCVLETAEKSYSSVKERMPEDPGDSIRRISSSLPMPRLSSENTSSWAYLLKHLCIWIGCYLLAFLYLRQYRCALSEASSWFAIGVEAIVGKCPAA